MAASAKNQKQAVGSIEIENVEPEVKSYIYQSLSEFEPYTTPTTTVAVIAKSLDNAELKRRNFHRISICLMDEGSKIEAEATDQDIFMAIRMAKENLITKLSAIQDSVVTKQERLAQINIIARGGNSNVH
jgi:ribosomal subunit interface protein